MAGILYVVATPIGNLGDITYRAVETLRNVDIVACEDTRQTRKLLDHYGISRPLLSLHEHNEAARAAALLERLEAGDSAALVSDAGTPLISDPGYRLVREASSRGLQVIPLPGPSAVTAALAASGLPTDRFRFEGFFPRKSGELRRALEGLRGAAATAVFFEAPHRILQTLAEINVVLPGAEVVLARELTKIHEEFLRGTPAALLGALKKRDAVRGEFTVLISPVEAAAVTGETPQGAVERKIGEGMARMDAIKAVARERGLPKRELYRLLEES
jgi:16S rRNA (cytidine1402-2'-O)-methyltransferase